MTGAILPIVIYATRSQHGGFAIGVGAFGRALWAQREPWCHRWAVWRTRAAQGVACGDEPGMGSTGVREPRRPLPGGLSGAVELRPPECGEKA
jgi:hypothetical protein